MNRRSFIGAMGIGGLFYTARGAFAQQLTLTPSLTIGPYYPNQMPLDLDNDLVIINDAITPAVGSITWLTGRVLDRNGSAVRGALVEIWQADNNGAYIHTASPITNRDKMFQGYGKFVTASDGRYVFRTVKPGLYPGRTRHIHMQVTYPGGIKFTTQVFVQGDPLNASDGVLSGVTNATQRNMIVVPFAPVANSTIGELSAVFDVVLGYTPSDTAAIAAPTIFALNGVVDGASSQPTVAAGSWISVHGSKLGPGTRTWTSADIVGGKLPEQLDGVSVSVNGKAASVYYISPSQLNVQVPSDVTGALQVKVMNSSGSATASATVHSLQPGFFLFTGNNVAAVRADGAYLGPAGLYDGLATIPAKSGDQVLLFGTGFGATNPAFAAGVVVDTAAPLVNPVKVFIDGKEAVVSYAGLTGVGLYQLNITVPSLANGDHPVTAQVGGVWTQSFATLRVQS